MAEPKDENYIETVTTAMRTTTWVVYMGGKVVFSGEPFNGVDHKRALAIAKVYTDKQFRGVTFAHRPTKQT